MARARLDAVTEGTQGDQPLWTIELKLITSGDATEAEAKEAIRGIKARRRKGNPMTCCCCPTTLGAAPFTLVLGRGNDDSIPPVEAGVCRRCGPDLEAASERAVQLVRGVWPALAGYELIVRQWRNEGAGAVRL